jgi:phage terminase large subunit-like protein
MEPPSLSLTQGLPSPRQLRALLRDLTQEQRAAVLASLPDDVAEALAADWEVSLARDAQLEPEGIWQLWLILAGRGFGKTRTGGEWIHKRVRDGSRYIALVAPTAGDARDVMVEGPAGVLRTARRGETPIYEPSKRRVTFHTGAVASLFSAEEPNRLRGPQHDSAWCDEPAAWKYPEETWDNLEFGLRLGTDPRVCATTTPRPTKLIKKLVAEARATKSLTRGSTYDNRANLAPSFLAKLLKKYDGTRLGRQELHAELLEDTPGALWTLDLLDENRVQVAPDLVRIVVAIDPQAADPNANPDEDGAETGIVAAGTSADGDGYILRDASGQLSPGEWGERAVLLFDELEADCIVGEANQGGAMVEYVVRTAAEKLYREKKRPTPHVRYISVHASRGKHTRAEPVAALDEQGRTHHVGTFPELEDQMSTWVPGQKSPDRMDARVWATTALMLEIVDRGESEDPPDPDVSSRWSDNGDSRAW